MNRKHKLCAIACIDNNNAIGYKNDLLIYSKRDLKHFKERTTGATVVMGGNTFRSLPNSLPLQNRTNIILSSKIVQLHSNMIICKDMHELYIAIDNCLQNNDVFIIGGESLYNEFQYIFDELYITHVGTRFTNSDRHFPKIIDNYQNHIPYDYWTENIDGVPVDMKLLIHNNK